jgi:hypothetical protein
MSHTNGYHETHPDSTIKTKDGGLLRPVPRDALQRLTEAQRGQFVSMPPALKQMIVDLGPAIRAARKFSAELARVSAATEKTFGRRR